MKIYKIINTRTGEIVRYREAKNKKRAGTGKTTQEKVILHMTEKQYEKYMKNT